MTSYLTNMVLHLTYNINPSYLIGLHQKRVIPNKHLFFAYFLLIFYLLFIYFLLNRCKALPCPLFTTSEVINPAFLIIGSQYQLGMLTCVKSICK